LNKITACVAAIAAMFAAPAFAADMAVKAPPPPAPVPYTWTGFYGGIQFGGGWSDEAVNYSPGDPQFAQVVTGTCCEQPIASGYRIPQSGAVGGLEAGYNWHAVPNWVLGLEADFSFSGMSGTASGTTALVPGNTQTTTAEQSTDWYGTVRGRAGWLATPNLLLFGTGGFAYGRVSDSANYEINGAPGVFFGPPIPPGFSFQCNANAVCFAGNSSSVRTGWTAGGGLEWLLDQHWSAKIEYQFVDLGTETVRVTAFTACQVAFCTAIAPGASPSFFNAAFHDRFNVVLLGLNYRF
jgi:outer membrane immunogenic protein